MTGTPSADENARRRLRNRLDGYTVVLGQGSVLVAVITVLFVAPITFAVAYGERLRMSDDYATLVAGINLAVLLIAVVDVHFSISKARELVASGRPLTAISPIWNDENRTYADDIKDHLRAVAAWLVTCALLLVSLVLLALWAAVVSRPPAPCPRGLARGITAVAWPSTSVVTTRNCSRVMLATRSGSWVAVRNCEC